MFRALLNMSFKVAPEDLASLPNFLTNDFSSDICACFTDNETFLLIKS